MGEVRGAKGEHLRIRQADNARALRLVQVARFDEEAAGGASVAATNTCSVWEVIIGYCRVCTFGASGALGNHRHRCRG
jgi:hypothetical protein